MKLNIGGMTETNCNLESNVFSIKASPIAFEILSSRLYANPVLAVVRELLTNAYDSHKASNNLSTPIQVHFPDYLDPNFIIRDYGTGLSKEDILEMYTTFFSSTKSDSNDFTGCFGLGSKTPFSYTSSFSVHSFFNGIKYFFVAIKKDGYPSIVCVREEETDEPNGLEIIIPTDNDGTFLLEANIYLRYIPEINITCNKEISRPRLIHELTNIKTYELPRTYYNQATLFIKQGQNVYPAQEYITNEMTVTTLLKMMKKNITVIEAPIGTLDITPSRESLSREGNNLTKIQEYIKETNKSLTNLLANDADMFKKIDVTTYLEVLSEKYFDTKTEATLEEGYKHCGVIDDSKFHARIRDCYINKLSKDESNIQSSYYIPSDAKHVILMKQYPEAKDRTKIRNILANYDIDNVFLISPHRNQDLISFVRQKYKILGIINNMPEYPEVDIDVISYPRFLREYPDHKRHKDKSCTPAYVKRQIRHGYVHLNMGQYGSSFQNHVVSRLSSIKNIKSTLPPEGTILVTGIDYYNWRNFLGVINLFIHKIKDQKGNNFVLDYLNSKGIDLWIGSRKIVNDQGQDEFHVCPLYFLHMAKTNEKYFKEYKKITKDEIYSLIESTKWLVNRDFVYHRDSAVGVIERIKRMFDFNYKGKALEYVQNNKAYKLIETITQIILNQPSLTNVISPNEATLLETENLSKNKLRQKDFAILNRLSTPLQLIQRVVYNEAKTSWFVDPVKKRNNHRIEVKQLTSTQKLIVLSILRGDKNVLF